MVGSEIDIGQARRGDLVFWNGHVAILRDHATFVHANAFHMCVAVEPVTTAIAHYSLTAQISHVRFQENWESAFAKWQHEENAVILVELPPASTADGSRSGR